MSRRCATLCAFVVVLAVVVGASPQQQQQQQQPQRPPAFTTSITAVPIDVRVIDNKTGKPVTDLEQEDFTLLEDGVVQPIRHFEHRSLTAGEAPQPGTRPAIRETPFNVAPQSNRIFLLVLGRGRLQEPSKALDALLHFVRTRLLPQDLVAVFAYDRATEFTTDHEQIARLIERFKQDHYEINMEVGLQMTSGLAAIYGSKSLPRKVQAKIDAMFEGAGTLASREIGRGETAATKRAEDDQRRAVDALQRADVKQKMDEVNAQAVASLGPEANQPNLAWTSMDEIAAGMFSNVGLDEFMEYNAQTLQDLGNCYAGIEYLRHIEGEKHLVFVTEKGMYLPRVDDDQDLANAANDARVVIDTFQTGGIEPQIGGAVQNRWGETFAFRALRNISEWTGGVSAIGENGMAVVDRLDQNTRSDYVLGYYPSLARFDGTYRKITVRVNRPDTTVLYRHGYYARRDVGSFDRRSFITRDRIQAAAAFSRPIKDIKVKLDAKLQRRPDGQHEVFAEVSIDPSRLALVVQDGVHLGTIDIAIVFVDEKGQMMGQHYQRADLKIAEDVWQKVAKSGIPYSAHIEMNPGVRQVRVIVYDYKADLAGSADARVW